ncbi:hypothetical protein TNCV_2951741 [Trichonephila clavipes]|nr:hypothetical protein TNCV_2951741 [Trichonephila clavipes]
MSQIRVMVLLKTRRAEAVMRMTAESVIQFPNFHIKLTRGFGRLHVLFFLGNLVVMLTNSLETRRVERRSLRHGVPAQALYD